MQPLASDGDAPPPYQPVTSDSSQPMTMQASTGNVPVQAPTHHKPPVIYSYNTKSISHIRRAMKAGGIIGVLLVLLFIAAVVAFWTWLGSPKSPDELFSSLKHIIN